MPIKQATKPSADHRKAHQAGHQSRRKARQDGAGRDAKKWSAEVTRKSNALDLPKDIFKSESADKIAGSLKHSAVTSNRRRTDPFRSALSMLTFYMNRAGRNLSERRRRTLTAAKGKLRRLFGRKRKLSVKRVQ